MNVVTKSASAKTSLQKIVSYLELQIDENCRNLCQGKFKRFQPPRAEKCQSKQVCKGAGIGIRNFYSVSIKNPNLALKAYSLQNT